MNKIWLCFISSLIFLSCSQKSVPEQKKEILSLKEMSDLATAEYTITKVVKANDNRTWYKVGDRKILLSCTGSIKAGVDLSALTEDAITINDKDITLFIPPAKVISLNIPPEKIKMEFQQVGFWRDKFSFTEQNELLTQAEMQIRSVADSIGVLKVAENNAKVFITGFLTRLGYKNVAINFRPLPLKTKLPG